MAVEIKLDTIGPYHIVGSLGTGGMAQVYRGTRYDRHGWVAIKLMHESMVRRYLEKYKRGDEDADQNNPLHMFLDEIIIHQDLDHRNVVRYLDEGHHKFMRAGEVIDQPYLVMEYVHGKSMVEVAKEGYFAAQASAELPRGWIRLMAWVVGQMCRGLHHLHELEGPDGQPRNAMHRDVSPKNVLLSHDGAVKVSDFGLARADQRVAGSKIGMVKGTPAYFSPEQTRLDDDLDRRSDIFSLGVILWEMTLFRRLFRRANELATIFAVRKAEIPRPITHCPWYPLVLQDVILRSTAKNREDRFETALAMAEAIDAALEETGGPIEQADMARLMEELFDFEPFPDLPERPPFFEQDPAYDQSTVRGPSLAELMQKGGDTDQLGLAESLGLVVNELGTRAEGESTKAPRTNRTPSAMAETLRDHPPVSVEEAEKMRMKSMRDTMRDVPASPIARPRSSMRIAALLDHSPFHAEIPEIDEASDEDAIQAANDPASSGKAAPFGGAEETAPTRVLDRPSEDVSPGPATGTPPVQPGDEISVSVVWDIDEAVEQENPRAGLFQQLRRLFHRGES